MPIRFLSGLNSDDDDDNDVLGLCESGSAFSRSPTPGPPLDRAPQAQPLSILRVAIEFV